MKTCTRCKTAKPVTDFYANGRWADGHHPYCKQCLLEYQRNRRRDRLDRTNPNRRRWNAEFVRHDYFEFVNRPEQAYVAGLLAADGNVLERQQRLTLELSCRDRQLVQFVRDELAPGVSLRERVRHSGTETAILAITSVRLCSDLARLGITPRKSLTLRWPDSIEAPLDRFFLLGYFDGDGFITKSRSGPYTYPRWGLLGTEAFLGAAMALISRGANVPVRRVRPHGTRNVHVLRISGSDAVVVDQWLRSGTDLGLARKRLSDRQADIAANSSSGR